MPRDPLERFRRLREMQNEEEHPPTPPQTIPGPAWLYAAGQRGPESCSLHRQLVALVADGATLTVAAMAAQIEELDLARWINAGAAGDPDYRQLYLDIRSAAARCQMDLIKRLSSSGKPVALRYVLESLSKGSFEPKPREIPVSSAPSDLPSLLRELRASAEDVERQLAREHILRQGESTPQTTARGGGDENASDKGKDQPEKKP